jgi:hypothetical protein
MMPGGREKVVAAVRNVKGALDVCQESAKHSEPVGGKVRQWGGWRLQQGKRNASNQLPPLDGDEEECAYIRTGSEMSHRDEEHGNALFDEEGP